MGRALAALIVLVALSGCSTATAPSPGLSAQEEAELRATVTESRWAMTGLYPDQRPATPSVTEVTLDDWGFAIASCMSNAGFDNYEGGLGGSYTSSGSDSSDAEIVAHYLCDVSFEVEGQYDSWYNDAQLDYLFDYYRLSLVPCLQQRGITITEAPTRKEFHAYNRSWHPYFAMSESERVEMAADPLVPVECPAVPPGIPDPHFGFIWGQP